MNFGWYLEQFTFKGRPVSGGTVEFFVAGSTTTPKNIWYDVANTVVAPNPITLDASGTMPQIYPESGLYLVVLKDADGSLLYTRDNVQAGGGGSTSDVDLHRFFTWFICLESYPKPPEMDATLLSNTDKEMMVKYGYPIAAQLQQSNFTTGTSLWYLLSYDGGDPTKDLWKEVNLISGAEIINVDRTLRRNLAPHFDLPINVNDQPVFTALPAGEYSLVLSGDKYWWNPQVVKEFPEPVSNTTSALIHDSSDDQYKWQSIDDIGGKVKVDQADSTAGYLSSKIIGDTDAAGNVNIVVSDIGADNTYKHLGLHVNTDTIYGEILDKMNPPSYDLFGAYPDEVGVCQLTGIGASLRAKTLKDAQGNNLAWNPGTGDAGAVYGRSCIPGYAYVLNATGTQIRKRVWCAFGSTGEIYNSFDRYNSTTRDTSLLTADASYSRIPQGAASCAAYIKDGSNYYWMYGGFVDNYVYLLEDIPANYNDDGTFKASGWVWTPCPNLPKNTAHICSVNTGGFLYTGYQLGGVNYKETIAGTGTTVKSNPPRTNADLVRVITGDGSSDTFALACQPYQSYNSPSATAVDSGGNSLTVSNVAYDGGTSTINVRLAAAPASGLVVTITAHSYQYNQTYDGAGFSGVGSDHYGTYNIIDRDTGRIYTNVSEATTGTFTPSAFNLLPIYVRNSSSDSYGTVKVDRLGTTFGNITSDPYTWWSSIQSAYGLWVATTALKQHASDPIYAYSDDGIHWTKYTDGIGTGTGSTLAIWDSQSDGMNWYVTNMYNSTPLIFELLVDSIPSHKRLVCEKGLGVSGDAFLVDMPSTSVFGTDENGKIVPSSSADIGKNLHLSDLADVSVASRINNQVLTWIDADSKWEPRTPSGGGSSLLVVDTYSKALIQSAIVFSPQQWSLYWTGFDLESGFTISPTSRFTAVLGQAGSSSDTFHFTLGQYSSSTSTYNTLAYSNNVGITTPGFIYGNCDSLSTALTLPGGRYYLGFVTNSTGASIGGLTASALFNDISPYFLSLKKDNLTSSVVPTSFTSVQETLTRYFIKLEA